MSMRVAGLSRLASDYDAFILDMWGVLHDGFTLYAGARDTLAALRHAGKLVLLLSNSPRRVGPLVDLMAGMGVGSELYDHILSSGEAVHRELARRADPFFAGLGDRVYHLGPDRDAHVMDGLGLTKVVSVADASFMLNTGADGDDARLDDFQPLLDAARARDLPMVCANPDLVVMVRGRPFLCAGAIAKRYAEMGGRVAMRGKPDPAIYAMALDLLGVDHRRVLAVGDALHTDIAGANGAGIDALFVTQGIHAAELGISAGAVASADSLDQLYARHGQVPMASIPTFVW